MWPSKKSHQESLNTILHYSVLPRIFLRRLAITSYYTNSKPSQSNGCTMLLPLSNSKPNMQVNQKSTVKLNMFIRMSKIKAVQDKERNIQRKI